MATMTASLIEGFGASWTELGRAAVGALAIYLAVIAATRLAGLRSFSKMSSFDFAMTVAIGSLIATVAGGQAALATALVGVAVLFAAQATVALLRRNQLLHGAVDNTPLLLMDGPQILHHNLAASRITLDDLHGKLREAGVLDYGDVRAVVIETTGDISVLRGPGTLDPQLLRGVRRQTRRH